jgi:spermidine synthase
MLMLGRCGGTFSPRDREQVEALLPALGATRAAFGLPFHSGPLTQRAPAGLLARLGLAHAVHAEIATTAGRVQVRDRGGFREMVALDQRGRELIWTRARLSDPRVSGWPYVDLFHVAAARAARRERALIIGAGGGAVLQQFAACYPGIALDLVERDAGVVRLARDWFGLDRLPRLTVTIGDGAAFVARAAPSSWDIAVVDAFDARSAVQPFFETPFLSSLARALCPDGALAMNWMGSLDAPTLASLVQRLESCFEEVRVLPVVEQGELDPRAPRNVVLVARRPPFIRNP